MEPSEYYNIAQVEDAHWWYVGMSAIVAGWLGQLPLPDSAAVLDAGCGTGGGLKLLARYGRPAGVDVHPLALRLAREKRYTSIAQADVQRLPFAGGAFDLVTSFDVLYHLKVRDDEQALRDFARVLAPGGWLLLRLPAHEWMRRGHDRTVHTRHRYTREEVRAKLAAAGLQPVRVTYANTLLLLPAAIRRALQRTEEETGGTEVQLPSRPINALLTSLLRLEGLWLRRLNLPTGLSVLALARKEEVIGK